MEEKTKNKYLIGVIGALIGALIGSLPWVLAYVFFNVIYAVLAIFIVAGSFYGYKITKAKINKKLPIILSITSFIAITIAMLLIIPMSYLVKSGLPVSIENFQFIYSNQEFLNTVLTDYVIALIFGIIVIGGIIVSLNKQIREGIEDKDIRILAKDASNEDYSKQDIDNVRKIFDKNDALDKHHTITKDLIMEDLIKEFGSQKAESIFIYLNIQQIIKKKSNKYYFCEKAQNSSWYRYGFSGAKTFVIIVIVAVIIASIVVFTQNYRDEENQNSNTIESLQFDEARLQDNVYDTGIKNIKIDMPDDMAILTADELNHFFNGSLNSYDCVASTDDFEKMVVVFTESKSQYGGSKTTTEEFIKKYVLQEDDTEIKSEKINDNEYFYIENEYTSQYNNKDYIASTYILDAGDYFFCIGIETPVGDTIDLKDIVK